MYRKKKYIFITLALILILVGTVIYMIASPTLPNLPVMKRTDKKNNSDQVVIPAQKQRLYQDVEFLTSVTPARNYLNLSSLNKVAEFIFKEFQKLDCNVHYQTYQAKGNEYKNEIGRAHV